MAANRPMAEVLIDISNEVVRARAIHPSVHSLHHAMGVLFEEVDELWEEVKKRESARDKDNLRREAIQVAATAIRLIEEAI